MMSSETPSPRNWKKNNNILAYVVAAVSFLGFLDAAYLTAAHVSGTPVPCSLTAGCEKVLSSSFASFGPVPLAAIGALYYLIIFFLILGYISTARDRFLVAVAWGGIASIPVTAGLLYLQLAVIQAICFYCMISAATSTILALTGICVLFHYRLKVKNRPTA